MALTFEFLDEIQCDHSNESFHVVLFIMLYRVVLTFESVNEILKCESTQMKATEQYFSAVQFVFQYLAN